MSKIEKLAKQLHDIADQLTALIINEAVNQPAPSPKERLVDAIKVEVNENKNRQLMDQLGDTLYDLGADRVADLTDEQVAIVAAKHDLKLFERDHHGQNFNARI